MSIDSGAGEPPSANSIKSFRYPTERNELIESVEIMVDYVKKNRLPVVVAGGTSAQPAVKLFRALWLKKYGKKGMPAFFSLGEIGTGLWEGGYTDIEKSLIEKRSKMIKERRKKLVQLMQTKPVFILEEFAYFGFSAEMLRKIFCKLGAKKVKIGVLTRFRGRPRIHREIDFFGVMNSEPFFYAVRRVEHKQRILPFREYQKELLAQRKKSATPIDKKTREKLKAQRASAMAKVRGLRSDLKKLAASYKPKPPLKRPR